MATALPDDFDCSNSMYTNSLVACKDVGMQSDMILCDITARCYGYLCQYIKFNYDGSKVTKCFEIQARSSIYGIYDTIFK